MQKVSTSYELPISESYKITPKVKISLEKINSVKDEIIENDYPYLGYALIKEGNNLIKSYRNVYYDNNFTYECTSIDKESLIKTSNLCSFLKSIYFCLNEYIKKIETEFEDPSPFEVQELYNMQKTIESKFELLYNMITKPLPEEKRKGLAERTEVFLKMINLHPSINRSCAVNIKRTLNKLVKKFEILYKK